MMRFGVVGGLVLGAVFAAVACGPLVEENHRHLAEQWCRDYQDVRARCDGADSFWTAEKIEEETEECIANEAWDWTDECGDKFWALRDCWLKEIPCDRWPAVVRGDDNAFCQKEETTFYGECRYTMDHGG